MHWRSGHVVCTHTCESVAPLTGSLALEAVSLAAMDARLERCGVEHLEPSSQVSTLTTNLTNMLSRWRAAFEVASLADMEARLKRFGVEYHKFIVPGTNAAQIFLWDPEGCAVTARAAGRK